MRCFMLFRFVWFHVYLICIFQPHIMSLLYLASASNWMKRWKQQLRLAADGSCLFLQCHKHGATSIRHTVGNTLAGTQYTTCLWLKRRVRFNFSSGPFTKHNTELTNLSSQTPPRPQFRCDPWRSATNAFPKMLRLQNWRTKLPNLDLDVQTEQVYCW